MAFSVSFSSNNSEFDSSFASFCVSGSGGTSDYNDLSNLPKLNGVTIIGDNTADYYNFGTVYDKDTGTTEGTIPIIGVGGKLDSSIIPNDNVQSDWTQSNNTLDDYIKNKPTIPSVPGDIGAASSTDVGTVASLTTTSKVVVGAINEINATVGDINTALELILGGA